MLQKSSARLVALDWRADDWIETLGLVLSFLSFNALILEAARYRPNRHQGTVTLALLPNRMTINPPA